MRELTRAQHDIRAAIDPKRFSLKTCKVSIPFRRRDIQPIKFAIDMFFLDGEPYAATDWAYSTGTNAPTIVLRLDKKHLRRTHSGSTNYTYLSVLDDPRSFA